jgi:hypothetical protein
VVVQTIGAWVTISAVLVGGGWAVFRYLVQQPNIPRVNATVHASLFKADDVDYVTFSVKITHVSGDILFFRREDTDRKRVPNEVKPHVEVSRLARISVPGDLPEDKVVEDAPVLRYDHKLGSGEFVEDHGIVSVGPRQPETMAYQVLFTFTGRRERILRRKRWTWSPNDILELKDATREIGAS